MKDDKDPTGQAISNFFHFHDNTPIVVKSSLIDDELLPPDYFFRGEAELPLLEKLALKHCSGTVLDVGAGAGCHSLLLQEKGIEVTALEISRLCCEVMKLRGIKNVVQADIFEYSGEQYDTILMLMNGVGLADSPDGLPKLIIKLKSLLKPNGKILLDSSDLIYLYEQPDGSVELNLNAGQYYGVVDYRLRYKQFIGKRFNWLFADQGLLADAAEMAGMKARIVEYGPHYDYLAEIGFSG